jgi:putative ABC transport system substrate-binding protein
MQVVPLAVRSPSEIEREITAFAQPGKGGLIVAPHAVTLGNRDLIVGLAARYGLPPVCSDRYFAERGLVSFGNNTAELFLRSASYIERVLKGAKPADLPVQLPTRFELIVNLKTANEPSLHVPAMMLSRADEVIE